MKRRPKSKTTESVRALLDTLSPRPRISKEAIVVYCGASGRAFKDAAKLRDYLKKLEA